MEISVIMKRNEIHTTHLTRGSRTYFFDIKKSEQGKLYLNISESKKTENGFVHQRLLIFTEDVKDFAETFQQTYSKFKKLMDVDLAKRKLKLAKKT